MSNEIKDFLSWAHQQPGDVAVEEAEPIEFARSVRSSGLGRGAPHISSLPGGRGLNPQEIDSTPFPKDKYVQSEDGLHYEIKQAYKPAEMTVDRIGKVTSRPARQVLDVHSEEAKARSKGAELLSLRNKAIHGKGSDISRLPDELKIGVASVVFGDEDERAEFLRDSPHYDYEEMDGLHFFKDKKTGKDYVLNKVGLDQQDVLDFAADAAQFVPAARISSKFAGGLMKSIMGALTSAGTGVARETGQHLIGGKFNLEAVIVDALGGAFGGALEGVAEKTLRTLAHKIDNSALKEIVLTQDQKLGLELVIKKGGLGERQITELVSKADELAQIAKREKLSPPTLMDVLGGMENDGVDVSVFREMVKHSTANADTGTQSMVRQSLDDSVDSAHKLTDKAFGQSTPSARLQAAENVSGTTKAVRTALQKTKEAEAFDQYTIKTAAQIDARVKRGLDFGGLEEKFGNLSNSRNVKAAKTPDARKAYKDAFDAVKDLRLTAEGGIPVDAGLYNGNQAITLRNTLKKKLDDKKLSHDYRESLKSAISDIEKKINTASGNALKKADDLYAASSRALEQTDSTYLGKFSQEGDLVEVEKLADNLFQAKSPQDRAQSVEFFKVMSSIDHDSAVALFEQHYMGIIDGVRNQKGSIQELRKAVFSNKEHMLDLAGAMSPTSRKTLSDLDELLSAVGVSEKHLQDALEMGADIRAGKNVRTSTDNPLYVRQFFFEGILDAPARKRAFEQMFSMALNPDFTSKVSKLLTEGRVIAARISRLSDNVASGKNKQIGNKLISDWGDKIVGLNKLYSSRHGGIQTGINLAGNRAMVEEINQGAPHIKGAVNAVSDAISDLQ